MTVAKPWLELPSAEVVNCFRRRSCEAIQNEEGEGNQAKQVNQYRDHDDPINAVIA